jgi:hypothetical protein
MSAAYRAKAKEHGRVAIAQPQLDDIHGAPPLDIQDTIVKFLLTSVQRRVSKVQDFYVFSGGRM